MYIGEAQATTGETAECLNIGDLKTKNNYVWQQPEGKMASGIRCRVIGKLECLLFDDPITLNFGSECSDIIVESFRAITTEKLLKVRENRAREPTYSR